MSDKEDKDLTRLIWVLRLLGWLLIAFISYYYLFPAMLKIIDYIFPLILPFILGIVLAALLEPLVTLIAQKVKVSRGISVVTTIVLIIGGIAAGFSWMIARTIMELVKLSENFPGYAEKIAIGLEYLFSQARILYFALELPADWKNVLVARLEDVSTSIISNVSLSLEALTAVPNGLLVLFFALISSYFFSKDKDKITGAIFRLLPGSVASFLRQMGEQTGTAILGYLRAQLILMLITMSQTLVGLYLLHVDYVLLITIVVGFLDLLPVFGPGLIFVPWIITAFFLGQMRLGFALLILYGIISLVRQLLQPKIVGDSIGIHPLETLISLYIGLKILGVLGLILGPILLVVLKGCWHYFQENKGGF